MNVPDAEDAEGIAEANGEEDEDVDDPAAFADGDDGDPYVIAGDGAVLLRQAQAHGDQKRWNTCNRL